MAGQNDPAVQPSPGYCQVVVVPKGMKAAVQVVWRSNTGYQLDTCVYHDRQRVWDFNNTVSGDHPSIWESPENTGPFDETYSIAGFYVPPNGAEWYNATLVPLGGGGNATTCEFHCVQQNAFDENNGIVKYGAVRPDQLEL
jgi:hypothetical protein